jgi:16S rRNA (cytosine1402-N4)-methyltransferase
MGAGEDEHVPVLKDEVLERLNIRPAGIYLDGTFGRGGHSRALLAQLDPDSRLVVVDRDPLALLAASELAEQDARVTAVRGNFGDIDDYAQALGVLGKIDGIVLDLGVSSPQLDDAERGFSFMRDGPLDMRMDPAVGMSAEEWLNSATESEMAQVITRYGEERSARRIARAISNAREQQRISRTRQLADLIETLLPRRGKGKHPATKTFQAIRIHINNELGELQSFLEKSLTALRVDGRLCIISFHSLEDRMVKRFMRDQSRVDPALSRLPVVPDSAQPFMRLAGGAIRPALAEIERNPRARSAVLRVAERIR